MAFEGTIDDGAPVYGSDGHKLGKVGQVFVLQGTDEPTWIAVQTGLFGMQESFVPVAGASKRGDELIVAYDKAFVKDAPRITGSDDLTVEQEAELYRYYGVEPPLRAQHDGQGRPDDGDRAGHDGPGGSPDGLDTADDERPRDAARDDRPAPVGPQSGHEPGQQPGREGGPRLRRRVVTEMQTVQVPVQREEIVVEGEGIETDDDRR
ncbi:PRC-barrel domain-containing protein [Agrococcus baldri]|uniref:PRC-barrel domain-containing protein n=1 Tax=Agrococcus baldri TaxID=153730 RepID=A0AA87REF8_9MICO|nr:PRC-barrel domain-containing protein [Agrococcus baldri]GEK81394.1 hypothetical protein ABA31_27450 [Agrococcus baldri]